MQKSILVFMLSICVVLGFSADSYAKKKSVPPQKPISEQKTETKPEGSASAGIEKNETTPESTKIIRQKPPTDIFSSSNPLGITFAENTLKKASFYLGEKDYESAAAEVNSILRWIEDATEYHTELYQTLNKLENSEVQAGIERELAIKFAVLRDKALLLSAKVDIANKNKRKAVKNLVEVVRSQPSTDLGFEAYQLLQKIGFTYKAEYETIEAPATQDTQKK
ncbi:MAG: hypothetical protein GX568_06585 [Candidatus Gastranaerophilales bacterium]|nr:hypothetical protein [Candidatus Gastranaerophilales bacterium]